MKINNLLLLTLAAVIGACGGGPKNSPSTEVSAAPVPTPVPSSSPVTLTHSEAIIAAGDFSFEAEKDLRINLQSRYSGKHFVALCVDDGAQTMSFTNCLFKGFITPGSMQKSWRIANNITALKLSVWQPQAHTTPDFYDWTVYSGDDWQVHYE